jgi:hypothetical protein
MIDNFQTNYATDEQVERLAVECTHLLYLHSQKVTAGHPSFPIKLSGLKVHRKKTKASHRTSISYNRVHTGQVSIVPQATHFIVSQ